VSVICAAAAGVPAMRSGQFALHQAVPAPRQVVAGGDLDHGNRGQAIRRAAPRREDVQVHARGQLHNVCKLNAESLLPLADRCPNLIGFKDGVGEIETMVTIRRKLDDRFTYPIGTNTLIAANYDFKVIKAYVAYGVDKGFNSAPLGNANNPFGGVCPTASTDGNEILLGLSAPAGPGTVLASVMRKDDKTSFNQDSRAWGVGYLYPLSKRTNLYTAYGNVDNKSGAGYTVANNTESASGDRAFNLGVRHTF
jgi:hypothetical protein